ncbi:MAG: hypothetical protein LBR70_00985 [Lactobacillaceae bacterium]|jgi:flagellar basal body-associated protein FliL|nr:hypothetical protein [Lactobacillaceae bacterium]
MRQKKSKKILYILLAAAIVVAALVLSRDISVNFEHVEEVVDNDFLTSKK